MRLKWRPVVVVAWLCAFALTVAQAGTYDNCTICKKKLLPDQSPKHNYSCPKHHFVHAHCHEYWSTLAEGDECPVCVPKEPERCGYRFCDDEELTVYEAMIASRFDCHVFHARHGLSSCPCQKPAKKINAEVIIRQKGQIEESFWMTVNVGGLSTAEEIRRRAYGHPKVRYLNPRIFTQLQLVGKSTNTWTIEDELLLYNRVGSVDGKQFVIKIVLGEKCPLPDCILNYAVGSKMKMKFSGCNHSFHDTHDELKRWDSCPCQQTATVDLLVIAKPTGGEYRKKEITVSGLTKPNHFIGLAEAAKRAVLRPADVDRPIKYVVELVDKHQNVSRLERVRAQLQLASKPAYVRVTMIVVANTIDVVQAYVSHNQIVDEIKCPKLPYDKSQPLVDYSRDCLTLAGWPARDLCWIGRTTVGGRLLEPTSAVDASALTEIRFPTPPRQPNKLRYQPVGNVEIYVRLGNGDQWSEKKCQINVFPTDNDQNIISECNLRDYADEIRYMGTTYKLSVNAAFSELVVYDGDNRWELDQIGRVFEAVQKSKSLVLHGEVVRYWELLINVTVVKGNGSELNSTTVATLWMTIRELFETVADKAAQSSEYSEFDVSADGFDQLTVHATATIKTIFVESGLLDDLQYSPIHSIRIHAKRGAVPHGDYAIVPIGQSRHSVPFVMPPAGQQPQVLPSDSFLLRPVGTRGQPVLDRLQKARSRASSRAGTTESNPTNQDPYRKQYARAGLLAGQNSDTNRSNLSRQALVNRSEFEGLMANMSLADRGQATTGPGGSRAPQRKGSGSYDFDEEPRQLLGPSAGNPYDGRSDMRAKSSSRKSNSYPPIVPNHSRHSIQNYSHFDTVPLTDNITKEPEELLAVGEQSNANVGKHLRRSFTSRSQRPTESDANKSRRTGSSVKRGQGDPSQPRHLC